MKTEAAFWDTSALVPLCCRQPANGNVRRLARRYGRMVVWWGSRVEALGALARLQREGALSENGFRETRARLRFTDSRSWNRLTTRLVQRLLAVSVQPLRMMLLHPLMPVLNPPIAFSPHVTLIVGAIHRLPWRWWSIIGTRRAIAIGRLRRPIISWVVISTTAIKAALPCKCCR